MRMHRDPPRAHSLGRADADRGHRPRLQKSLGPRSQTPATKEPARVVSTARRDDPSSALAGTFSPDYRGEGSFHRPRPVLGERAGVLDGVRGLQLLVRASSTSGRVVAS